MGRVIFQKSVDAAPAGRQSAGVMNISSPTAHLELTTVQLRKWAAAFGVRQLNLTLHTTSDGGRVVRATPAGGQHPIAQVTLPKTGAVAGDMIPHWIIQNGRWYVMPGQSTAATVGWAA